MLPTATIDAIVEGRYADPFAVLGIHEADGRIVVRAFVPGAARVDVVARDGATLASLSRRHDAGFFEGVIGRRTAYRLRAANERDAWLVDDPYAYAPVLGPLDDWLIGEGTHAKFYDGLGAHAIEHEGVEGAHFAVWAPKARCFRSRPIPSASARRLQAPAMACPSRQTSCCRRSEPFGWLHEGGA